jgi:ankyrin repeat protein
MLEVIKALLDKGADPTLNDSKGSTALWYAMEDPSGGDETVKLLTKEDFWTKNKYKMSLQKFVNQPDPTDPTGKLKTRERGINKEAQEFLADLSKKQQQELNERLKKAIDNDEVDTFTELIKDGADPFIKNNQGQTCLHITTQLHKDNIVKKLITYISEQKKNNEISTWVNTHDNNGKTAYALAVELKEKNVEKSEEPHFNMQMYNKKKEAKENGKIYEEIINLLEPYLYSNIIHRQIKKTNTPEEIKKIKNLIENPQTDINQKNNNGTCLYEAVSAENKDVVKLLLENKNIDPNSENEDLYSPLYLAVWRENDEIVKLLLDNKKININAICRNNSEKQQTPLNKAVANKNVAIVKLLLEHNADRTIKNSDGKTPEEVARSMDVKELIELFEQKNNPSELNVLTKLLEVLKDRLTDLLRAVKNLA